jgi:hypothetical protein
MKPPMIGEKVPPASHHFRQVDKSRVALVFPTRIAFAGVGGVQDGVHRALVCWPDSVPIRKTSLLKSEGEARRQLEAQIEKAKTLAPTELESLNDTDAAGITCIG